MIFVKTIHCMFIVRKKIWITSYKGALLVEVLLAIFVISIGLLAVMQLITGSIQTSFLNRDTIIATGLSQEGAELVRNIRDNSFVATPSTPFIKFSTINKFCSVTYETTSTLTCTRLIGSSYALHNNGSTFYTTSASNPLTKFQRLVYIDYNNVDKAEVTSFVYWGNVPISVKTTGGKGDCSVENKCVYTDIVLTKWKEVL